MFGYVITNCKTLSEQERARFRAMYCGMCHTLRERYGHLGRFTLSYDMTFVAMVISALYEQKEILLSERCLPHMLKAHDAILSPAMEYAVDLNVALAYQKCADNWQDDKNPAFAAAGVLLKGAYRKACEAQGSKCRAIEEWMDAIRRYEKSGSEEIDPPMNLTGKMMGTLFQFRNDFFAEELYRMGDGLGRFIYLMDAYDDLETDVKRKKFNPLKSIMHQPDFEEICRDALTMAIADSAAAFEALPILRDADLIRNILYSGVWAKYGYIQSKKAKSKGAQ